MSKQKYICPVCGYDGLDEPAYGKNGEPSYNICSCCCFEYGVDDSCGYRSLEEDFNDYRGKWIEKKGCKWFEADKKPQNWELSKQLNNLQGYIFQKNRTYGPYEEFQYCDSKSKEISHWKSDSIYMDIGNVIYNDIFYPSYFRILNVAKLPNGEIGFDPFGENYYSPEQTKSIYEQIEKDKKLPDRKVLLDWLKVAVEKKIGFYILGE